MILMILMYLCLLHNLIEYSDVSSKTSGSLWQYYIDELALENNTKLLIFLLIIIVFISSLSKKPGQTAKNGTNFLKW